MRKFLVTCSLVVAAMIAAIIEYYCSPWKSYFTMSIVAIFFLYWGVEFVLDYANAVKGYPERYQVYLAQQVNKLNLPLETFQQNNKKYYAKFKRSIFKERMYQIFKFLFCFGAGIGIVVAMAI